MSYLRLLVVPTVVKGCNKHLVGSPCSIYAEMRPLVPPAGGDIGAFAVESAVEISAVEPPLQHTRGGTPCCRGSTALQRSTALYSSTALHPLHSTALYITPPEPLREVRRPGVQPNVHAFG